MEEIIFESSPSFARQMYGLFKLVDLGAKMSIKSLSSFFLGALALVVFTAVGCEKPSEGYGDGQNHDSPAAGHEHVHDHPAHGPNGGHMFPLDTEEFQAEWKKYTDNNVIKIYVLDAAGKEPALIKADSFVITPKVGEGGDSFELKADAADENGMSSVYMLDDADLAMAIPLGVDIEIKVGEKTMKGEIKAHEPLDH